MTLEISISKGSPPRLQWTVAITHLQLTEVWNGARMYICTLKQVLVSIGVASLHARCEEILTAFDAGQSPQSSFCVKV